MNINKDLLKKQALLTGTGIALQLAGSLFLCAASLLAMKEIVSQIKNHLELLATE